MELGSIDRRPGKSRRVGVMSTQKPWPRKRFPLVGPGSRTTREAHTGFVERRLGARKNAVVAQQDEQRVVPVPGLFEDLSEAADPDHAGDRLAYSASSARAAGVSGRNPGTVTVAES
jgi:hypothetical protein